MKNVFQPSTHPHAFTLLKAASEIVATSALALADDHEATVEIVATTLGTFPADEVDEFTARAFDPATAARIVCAALEDAASAHDDATVEPMASATPLPASVAAQADPGATPLSAMFTMIKVMLPLVERMVEAEDRVAGHAEMGARLIRLEQRVAALSRV